MVTWIVVVLWKEKTFSLGTTPTDLGVEVKEPDPEELGWNCVLVKHVPS